MPGRITDGDIRSILNNRFGGVAMPATPTNYYVGLSTAVPTSDGAGAVEPASTTGYKRVLFANNVTNFPSLASPSRSPKTNGTPITFPTATADWGLIVAWLLWDSETGTVATGLRTYGTISPGVSILATETRSFPAGALSISAPGN